MSKRIKVGDRVIFKHTNPELHDRRDGETASVTEVLANRFLFDGTAYAVRYADGVQGLAFRNELVLAEDVLVS